MWLGWKEAKIWPEFAGKWRRMGEEEEEGNGGMAGLVSATALRVWSGGCELSHFGTGACQSGKAATSTDHGTTDHGLRGRGRDRILTTKKTKYTKGKRDTGTLGDWNQG